MTIPGEHRTAGEDDLLDQRRGTLLLGEEYPAWEVPVGWQECHQ